MLDFCAQLQISAPLRISAPPFYKVFEFLCCSLVLNRNKDSVILRLKIDKRNKRPPLNERPPLA